MSDKNFLFSSTNDSNTITSTTINTNPTVSEDREAVSMVSVNNEVGTFMRASVD